ncbi:MAG TPA: hypothetical protein VL651_17530 [Bacteroidia bacterium]|nr:hypothetical protein [Bacteroidia bacterium]
MFRIILFYFSLLLLLTSIAINIALITGYPLPWNLSWTFLLHFCALGVGMYCVIMARKEPLTRSLLDKSRSGLASIGGIINAAWKTRPKWMVLTGMLIFIYAMICFLWTFFPEHLEHADPSLPPAAQQVVEDQLEQRYQLLTFSGVWIYLFFFCFGYLWKFRKRVPA